MGTVRARMIVSACLSTVMLSLIACGGSQPKGPSLATGGHPPDQRYRPELIIKLKDHVAIVPDRTTLVGDDLAPVLAVLNAYDQSAQLQPVYPRFVAKAQAWELTADLDSLQFVQAGDALRIMRYTKVQTKDFADARKLARKLAALDEVERVFPRPVLMPTDDLCFNSSSPVPDMTADQGYLLGAIDHGMGSKQAWETVRGTDGFISTTMGSVDVMVIDGYLFDDHRDLPAEIEVPIPYSNPNSTSIHGTSVMGILAAQEQEVGEEGYIGMVPRARFHFGAYESLGSVGGDSEFALPSNLDGVNSIDSALDYAAEVLSFGDVLVISLGDVTYQKCDGSSNPLQVPVNASPLYRELLIGLAEQGVAVVLSAGNEQLDLTTTSYPPPCADGGSYFDSAGPEFPWLEGEGSPPIMDSGSIIVGAGVSTGSAALTKYGTSNYGERVDCQGWGDHVATLGFQPCTITGDCGVASCFTTDFSQTSAAAPTVAGVIASLQGARQATGMTTFTSTELRELLGDDLNGSPQPAADRLIHPIGPRPDLTKLLASTGVISEIYVRDTISEEVELEGSSYQPYHRPRAFRSPDLLLMEINLSNVSVATDGENYAENEPDFVARSSEAKVAIVRAKNIGTHTSSAVVHVYRSPATPLAPPESWNHIGEAEFDGLAAGAIGAVIASRKLPRHASSRPFYSWILLTVPEDAPFEREEVEGLGGDFLEFLDEHQAIRFRNVERVRILEGSLVDQMRPSERFRVRLHDLSRYGPSQSLRIRHRLPQGSILELKAKGVKARIDVHDGTIDLSKLDPLTIPFSGLLEFVSNRILLLPEFRFRGPEDWFDLELRVLFPPGTRHRSHAIHIEQLIPDPESGEPGLVGRMTFLLGNKPLGPS